MSENQEWQGLEALGAEKLLLQQQLIQAKEELKLEVENSKLREQLARYQLRKKASKYNFLAQAASRAPKPIARIIFWLSYAAPFFFVFNTLGKFSSAAGRNNNNFTLLLSILKAAGHGIQERNSFLEEAIAMQAKNLQDYEELMFISVFWLSYTTLKWHYNGAPITKNIFLQLPQNPLLPLAMFGACRISLALSWGTQNFYTTLQESQKAEINPILIQLGIPESIESYYRFTAITITTVAFWTLFAILLNKKLQREATPKKQELK